MDLNFNELNIDNYIVRYETGEIQKVYFLEKEDINKGGQFAVNEAYIDCYEGIPITKEVLDHFNFVDNHSYCYECDGKMKLIVIPNQKGFSTYVEIKINSTILHFPDVIFVHQLQNLYYTFNRELMKEKTDSEFVKLQQQYVKSTF